MKKNPSKPLMLVLGLLLGCIASLVIVALAVKQRTAYLSESMGMAQEPAVTTPPAANPSATEDIADPQIYALLATADAAIQSNNPQKALDLIKPEIENWSSPIDKATGYQLLAVAEFNLGHPQQAIPYAKKMGEYDPGAFSLLLLAQSYDYSGDLTNALATYQQILALSETDSRVDYNFVRGRATILSTTLGTPIP